MSSELNDPVSTRLGDTPAPRVVLPNADAPAARTPSFRAATPADLHRAAFDQCPDGTVIYDAAGRPVEANRAFERLWGVTLADLPAGYTILHDPELETAGVLPDVRRAFGGEIVTLPPFWYDMAATVGRGETLRTRVYLYPVLHSSGAVQQVVLRYDEVAPDDLREAKHEAAGHADRLQTLSTALSTASTVDEVAEVVVAHATDVFDAVGTVIARLTHDGKQLEIIRAGAMPDDIRNEWLRFDVRATVPMADVARTGRAIFLESRADWAASYPELVPMLEATGQHANAVMPLVVDGRVLGVLGVAFDTPRAFGEDERAFARAVALQCAQALERARLFEAERHAREEAEAANRAKAEFLAVMSHELRTPLNAIGGYAELIEMGIRGPTTAEQREDLLRIKASQQHLLGLINEVLNYAKLETGAVHYDLADIPVRDAIRAAETLVAPQARVKGLVVSVAECPAHIVVRADAEKLRQILVNLIGNAIKFTDRGGHVDVGCDVLDDQVRIRVSDNGIGIPSDKLEAIFQPFVQVRASLTRTADGTGLGLAISRDLARAMGGDVTVESVLDVGTTLTLRLPRA